MKKPSDLTDWQQRELSITEVMRLYGISRPTVWRWVRKGLLPQPKAYGPQTRRWSGAELAKIREAA